MMTSGSFEVLHSGVDEGVTEVRGHGAECVHGESGGLLKCLRPHVLPYALSNKTNWKKGT